MKHFFFVERLGFFLQGGRTASPFAGRGRRLVIIILGRKIIYSIDYTYYIPYSTPL